MSAHRPVRRAMFAISSRKALCLAERACPHGHVVACLPSLSRAGSALGAVALLVFAPIAVVTHGSA